MAQRPARPAAASASAAGTRRPRNRRGASARAAIAHLRAADPLLGGLIDALGPLPDGREGRPDREDHYGALVRSIVGQQLSVLAARAIYGRLTARFGGRPPTPAELLAADAEELRAAAGLSRAKVSFLRSLAEHVVSGELELERLDELPDEEVISELVAVKGLGVWTAQMFLMFHLERPDVLPTGDLGIRRAFERLYSLPGLPEAAEMERIAEPWRPHRTLACRYLWASLRNEPG
jgi:DNA-3-methyladenine glycosylase II